MSERITNLEKFWASKSICSLKQWEVVLCPCLLTSFRGHFGVVREGVHKESGRKFAVKIINKHQHDVNRKMLDAELNIMKVTLRILTLLIKVNIESGPP